MRHEYAKLHEALEHVRAARQCIRENRGEDRELAREGYDSAVAEILDPALTEALEVAIGDLDPREVERIADYLLNRLKRDGHV